MASETTIVARGFVIVAVGALLTLLASAAFAQSAAPALPNRGAAPELQNRGWLNTTTPLQLADLRGQVVLLEFWTYDCINCIHTLPTIQAWHDTYATQGLQVLGVHFPEFAYEHDLQNVRAAIERHGLTYPVTLDNRGLTWDAYGQRFWPTVHLIDKQGNIRYTAIGEGNYARTEAAIQALLAEPYTADATATPTAAPAYLVATEVLNVRSGAGIDQPLIGAIDPNMAFVILAEQNGWYAIEYGDFTGYVSGEYVTVVSG
jgi:uncharacterized protein YgiM (DUF1202 family)